MYRQNEVTLNTNDVQDVYVQHTHTNSFIKIETFNGSHIIIQNISKSSLSSWLWPYNYIVLYPTKHVLREMSISIVIENDFTTNDILQTT